MEPTAGILPSKNIDIFFINVGNYMTISNEFLVLINLYS